jgi:hypothetical protein
MMVIGQSLLMITYDGNWKMIQKEWIDWARKQIAHLKDGGHLVYPLDGKGVVFRVDKIHHTLITLCEHPEYHMSKTDVINREVFKAIGYSTVRDDKTPTNLADAIAKIQAQGGLTVCYGENVIEGLVKIFNTSKSIVEKMLHEAGGNKEPINPVSFRGVFDSKHLSLLIGRLWIGDNSLTEGQHKFDPTHPGETIQKTMQVAFYEKNNNILGFIMIDENEFVPRIKEVRTGLSKYFSIRGQTRPEPLPCEITFSTDGHNQIMVAMFKDGAMVSSIVINYDHFTRGLDHLFVRGELIVPENN